jgi:DNA-binding GntR family transcriptional regulator
MVQMLQILEMASLELAVEQIDMAKLDALEAELLAVKELGSGVSYDETSMPGIKLHDLILKASGNEMIVYTCNKLREQMRALSRLAVGAPGRVLESNDEHIKILRALKAKNVVAAQKAAMEHLANMYRVVTQVVV